MTQEITIGEALRMFRDSLGITQAEIGDRTGLGRMHIARLEGPKSNPTLKTLAHFTMLGFSFGVEAMIACNQSVDHFHLRRRKLTASTAARK